MLSLSSLVGKTAFCLPTSHLPYQRLHITQPHSIPRPNRPNPLSFHPTPVRALCGYLFFYSSLLIHVYAAVHLLYAAAVAFWLFCFRRLCRVITECAVIGREGGIRAERNGGRELRHSAGDLGRVALSGAAPTSRITTIGHILY